MNAAASSLPAWNGWAVLALVEAAGIVLVLLIIEVDHWWSRRRPPGAGALREARRSRRDRRPW